MSSEAPRLVRSLLSPGALMGVGMMFGYGLLGIASRRPLETFLAIIMVVFGAARTYQTIRVASTRVTETGVSQLTWIGRVHLSFAEVTRVSRKPFEFALSGPHGRVIVPVEVFENTTEAIGYIESRLPTAVVRP